MNTQWHVGILGLGNISQGYDDPDGPDINTHIKACLNEPRLVIDAISDIDIDHAERVRKKWRLAVPIFRPHEFLNRKYDIICIATPDSTHVDFTLSALQSGRGVILCEKPLGPDLAAVKILAEHASQKNTALAVNFLRRWLPGVSHWITQARSGNLGTPISARLVYCRGWRHNGCHGMDLIGAAMGASSSNVIFSDKAIFDFSAHDPTISGSMLIESDGTFAPVEFVGLDGRTDAKFEMELQYSKGLLRIWDDNGMNVLMESVVPFEGGVFNPKIGYCRRYHDCPRLVMKTIWSNLANFLEHRDHIECTADDVLDGVALLETVSQTFHAT